MGRFTYSPGHDIQGRLSLDRLEANEPGRCTPQNRRNNALPARSKPLGVALHVRPIVPCTETEAR